MQIVIEDVQEEGTVLIAQIPDFNTSFPYIYNNYKIEDLNQLGVYKKHVAIRKPNTYHRRLFVSYRAEKCTIHAVGIRSISKILNIIANVLKINGVNAYYTDHCFCR